MNYVTVGQYVTYKGATWMVVSAPSFDEKAHILNPLQGQGKLHVLVRNLEATRYRPAAVVAWRHSSYIVTDKGLIISCKTKRIMNWCEGDGNREAILDMAEMTG